LRFLHYSDITDEGFKVLAGSLKELGQLETVSLDFSYCENKTNKGLCSLCETMEKLGCLQNVGLSFKGCKSVMSAGVRQAKEHLKSLPFGAWIMISEEKEERNSGNWLFQD